MTAVAPGAVALVVMAALLAGAAWRHPVPRSIALATLRREPGRAVLVLAGVALGAALLTTSAVMQDSVDASVRYRARQQLGPVSTLIVARDPAGRSALDSFPADAGLDPAAVLRLTVTTAAVTSTGFVPFEEPQAQVVEADFAAAAAFGADRDATGIDGPSPGPGEAVVNADLAVRLNLSPGSRVQLHVYGADTTFVVVRILPKRGVAGLLTLDGPTSSRAPDLFVAPGTLDRLWAAGPAGAPPPVTVLAVAGGAAPGRLHDAAARHGSLEVRPVAADIEAEAALAADRWNGVIEPAVVAGVVTGLLLLVLTVAIGIDRRRRTLAELRAMGVARRGALVLVGLESGALAVAGAVLGALLGLGLAAIAVVAAAPLFAPDNAPAVLTLRYTATVGGVLTSITQATFAGLVVGTMVGVVATRGPIVAALAGGPGRVRIGRPSRLVAWAAGSPTAELALAYPRARPARAAAIIIMFAVTAGSTTALLTVGRAEDAAAVASVADLGGGATVMVGTIPANPLRVDLATDVAGVAWSVAARSRPAALTVDGTSSPVTIVAADPALAEHQPPALAARTSDLADDAAAWRSVLTDPSRVIVGADLGADAAGLHRRELHPGDEVELADPHTGRSRRVGVAAVARQAQHSGTDHVYGAPGLVEQLAGSPVPPDLLFVGTASDQDPARVAGSIVRLHPTQVVDAVSFDALAGDRLHLRRDVLAFLIGLSALSLLAGMTASGLVTAGNVHDRRRDLGVLRALGADDHRVRQVLRLEATLLALAGTAVGIGAGVLVAWVLLRTAGTEMALTLPWLGTLVVVVLVVGAARAAVWIATTVTLGVRPAAALQA